MNGGWDVLVSSLITVPSLGKERAVEGEHEQRGSWEVDDDHVVVVVAFRAYLCVSTRQCVNQTLLEHRGLTKRREQDETLHITNAWSMITARARARMLPCVHVCMCVLVLEGCLLVCGSSIRLGERAHTVAKQ